MIKELSNDLSKVINNIETLKIDLTNQMRMITKSEKEREDLSELINAAEEKESQFYKDLEEINKKTKANGVSSTLGGEERKAALKEEKLKLKNNKKIFEELRNANDYTKSLFKKDWSK